VSVTANPADCNLLFDPVGGKVFKTSCDIARQTLIGLSVNYQIVYDASATQAVVKIGSKAIPAFDGNALEAKAFGEQRGAFAKAVGGEVVAAGYPAKADPAKVDQPMLIAVLVYLALLVTMVYGPIAAALVELFPTRIRYTAMSLPYHIGNGWFGGLLPPIVVTIVAATGDIYAGLWYPIIIALITFVVGLIFIPETKDRDIYADD
jgi:MFS family permease